MKKLFALLLIITLLTFSLCSLVGCKKPEKTVPVSEESFDLSTLKGCVLHMVGQGGTPEIVLKKVLDEANIEYVDGSDEPVEGKVAIVYHEEGSEVIGALKAGTIQFAILGEPAVSTALQKVGENLIIAADLQQEWKIATKTDVGYPQTGLVAKSSLIESDPELVKTIAKLTVDNALCLKTDAASLIACLKEKGATVPEAFSAEGVARTNIDPTFSTKARTDLVSYFNTLYDFKPAMIGGKLPDNGFYYDCEDLQTYKENTKVFTKTNATGTKVTDSITIVMPDGGPALAMAYLMKDYQTINGTRVTYKIVDGAQQIRQAIVSGEADLAIMPTNLAATLYNNNFPIKLIGTNSYGLLYLLARKA